MKLKKKKVIKEKPVEAGPEESAVLASTRCGKTNYPPKLSKWGSEITREDVESIIEIWAKQGTVNGRSKLLVELLTGLTLSQLWEVYVMIKDVGTLKTRRERDIHKSRLETAINRSKVRL